MRKFKTPEQDRTTYIYYTVENEKITITPEDVDESWIMILYKMDDEEFNALRRNDYHTPVHYEAYSKDAKEDSDDRNPYLSDEESDPLRLIL